VVVVVDVFLIGALVVDLSPVVVVRLVVVVVVPVLVFLKVEVFAVPDMWRF